MARIKIKDLPEPPTALKVEQMRRVVGGRRGSLTKRQRQNVPRWTLLDWFRWNRPTV